MNPPKRYDRGTRGRISLPASDISFRYFKSAPTSISSQDQKSVFWKSYNEVRINTSLVAPHQLFSEPIFICNCRNSF